MNKPRFLFGDIVVVNKSDIRYNSRQGKDGCEQGHSDA